MAVGLWALLLPPHLPARLPARRLLWLQYAVHPSLLDPSGLPHGRWLDRPLQARPAYLSMSLAPHWKFSLSSPQARVWALLQAHRPLILQASAARRRSCKSVSEKS